jgi:signal transduction histidine kinase
MLANVCNAFVFAIASWGTEKFLLALGWATLIWSIVSVMVLRQWMRRAAARGVARRRRGVRRLLLYALALGSAWAALPLLFFGDASLGGKLLITCLSSGMLGGGVFVMASLPVAAIAFSGPIAIGALIALLQVGDRDHVLMAVVLAVYSTILFLGSFNYAKELRTLVATQIAAEEKASASAKNLGALAEMAAGLAHEISQPLAAAAAYIQSAERLLLVPAEKRPVPIAQPLRDAATQLENVHQIIVHLRDSITNRKAERKPLHLHETIQDVIQANRRRQENAGIRIDANLKAADDLVLANPVEMRQIFTNLISNAFDAMESSPERALAISSRATSDNAIRIDFADTGVGISPAIKTKLFEPLMTTKSRGLGVGLSITRSIVEEHEGQIWAEPNPGGGAVFTVVLPVEKAPAS